MADTRTTCVEIGESKFTSRVVVGHHEFVSDEPLSAGGSDLGPSPYELLASGLGACTVMTIQMYASHKKWDLKGVRVDVKHRKENAEDGKSKLDVFSRDIEFMGDFDENQYKRMLTIADKCPVHKTLSALSKIETKQIR